MCVLCVCVLSVWNFRMVFHFYLLSIQFFFFSSVRGCCWHYWYSESDFFLSLFYSFSFMRYHAYHSHIGNIYFTMYIFIFILWKYAIFNSLCHLTDTFKLIWSNKMVRVLLRLLLFFFGFVWLIFVCFFRWYVPLIVRVPVWEHAVELSCFISFSVCVRARARIHTIDIGIMKYNWLSIESWSR